MAKRRVVNVAVDKHAEGESFSKEMEKKGRYMVGIALESLKTITHYDTLDRTSEFYFEVEGGKLWKKRVPDKGVIELRENQVFESKSNDFTMWCEFITFKEGEDKVVPITIRLREEDPGSKDELLGEITIKIKCPQETDYMILDSKDGKTKAKLKIFAKKTLY